MRIDKIIKSGDVIPSIIISAAAYRMMRGFVDNCKDEIGWLALVKKEDENTYFIYDVLICDQEVTGASTDLNEKGLQLVAEELLQTERGSELNNVRCWGHSHVNMAVSPSTQDNETFEEYYTQCGDFFIRLIMNKRGEYYLDLANYESELIYRNLEFSIQYDEEEFHLRSQYAELMKNADSIKKKIDELEKNCVDEISTKAKQLIHKHIKYKPLEYKSYHSENTISLQEMDSYDCDYSIDELLRYCEDKDEFHIFITKKSCKISRFISDLFMFDEIQEMCYLTTHELKKKYENAIIEGEKIFRDYTYNDWKNLGNTAENYMQEYYEMEMSQY